MTTTLSCTMEGNIVCYMILYFVAAFSYNDAYHEGSSFVGPGMLSPGTESQPSFPYQTVMLLLVVPLR